MDRRRARWNVGSSSVLFGVLLGGGLWLYFGHLQRSPRVLRTPGSGPELHVSVNPTVASRLLAPRSSSASRAVSEASAPSERADDGLPAHPSDEGGAAWLQRASDSEPSAPERATTRAHERATVRLADCAPDLRLVGSAINAARPQLSRAVVRNTAGAFVVGRGARVGDLIVHAIGRSSATLRDRRGDLCAVRGFSSPAPAAAPEPPPPVAAPAPAPRNEPRGKAMFARDELTEGVRPLGGGAYRVSRKLLLKGLTNPGGAASGAWFRPHQKDGHSGMEVRAVREGTALSALGIATGDVAKSVNGIAIDSPQGLLSVLRAVRESNSITIALVRDGAPQELRYFVE